MADPFFPKKAREGRLEETARKLCGEVHVIGSAVKAGNALTAIHDGYAVGLEI